MEEVLTNEDKNNNGIPDWAEERVDDQTTFPEGDLGHAFTSEEKIAAKIPNYKDYKWYRNPAQEGQPDTGYFYTLGEKIENAIESDPVEAQNVINDMAEQNPEISKEDVKPVLEEAKQAEDGGADAEVNNEVIEKAVKKLGAFLPDLPEKKIGKDEYDDMSIDDIADADELAMKGDGDYLTVIDDTEEDDNILPYVADSIDPDNRYYIDTSLDDYANESFEVNKKEEKKEEEEEKKKKSVDLSKFIPTASSPDVHSAGTIPFSKNTSLESDNKVVSGVKPTSPSFAGSSSGSGGYNGSSVNAKSPSADNNVVEANAYSSEVPELAIRDKDDVGSQNGTNANKGIDDQFDSLSFEKTNHEGNINTSSQFRLNGKEGHIAKSNKLKLSNLSESKDLINDIKKAIINDSNNWDGNDSKEKFLPFRFIIDGGDIIVSQIGTARKLPFEEFIKKEPTAIKQIMEKLG